MFSLTPPTDNNPSPDPSFALNYKKLPFKRIEVPFSAIEATAKSLGASPTGTWPNGTPEYTIPILRDSDSGAVISDSVAIAEYLDKTYPDAPRLFGEGTVDAQRELIKAREGAIMILAPVLVPKVIELYLDDLKEVIKTRGVTFEGDIPQEKEKELWDKARKTFEEVETRLGGTEHAFADLALAGVGWNARCGFGEDTKEWKEIKSWAGGKVGKATDAAVEYESRILSA